MIGIGSRVKLLCGLNGKIVGYNSSTGLYHKDHFPYIVKRDDGETFEYSKGDIVKVIRYVAGEHKEVSLPFFAGTVLDYIGKNPRGVEEILGVATIISEVNL